MRSLKLKREKSFVGCLITLKVYVEEPFSGELMINGVPCRKVGTLKNGEEKTFVINDGEMKVYVIADRLTKEYCNDFYSIPAGTEDVYLSGKCRLDPLGGNAFLFNGVPREEVNAKRKKGRMIGAAVLLVALIIGGIAGAAMGAGLFSNNKAEKKEFQVKELHITLTNQFTKDSLDGFEGCFESPSAMVACKKEKFSLLAGSENYTIEQYGALVLKNSNFGSDVQLKTDDGLIWFEYDYTDPTTKLVVKYYNALYKGPNAFWIVQFGAPKGEWGKLSPKFKEWAKSVWFDE